MSVQKALVAQEAKKSKCKNIIKFQSKSLKVAGIEIPISKSGDKTIKIGNTDLSPQRIRKASDLVQLADTIQFTACQDLSNLPKGSPPELIKLIITRKFNALDALIKFAGIAATATNTEKVEEAIDELDAKLKSIDTK